MLVHGAYPAQAALSAAYSGIDFAAPEPGTFLAGLPGLKPGALQ